MSGTLHSKGFQAKLIFCAVMLCGSLSAFNALANSPNEDSVKAIASLVPTFTYEPDTTIKVENSQLKAGLLYDVQNQRIVWEKDMNKTYPIASLTKMMVALLTVEDIRAGKVHWDDEVAWTRDVYYWKKKKKIRSTSDVSYSLIELFKNSMIASNNEASEQMARYVGEGNLDAFIQRMNMRARELGMMSTYYGNPTGLPSYSRLYDNSSTPVDLLVLTLEMLKYPEIIDVTRMDYADISSGGNKSTTISNHNRLTIDYKGQVDGMKTGYTKRAGFCLVASSYKCDHRLISIVLGSRAPGTRNDIVRGMFDDYYSSIGLDKLSPYCNAPEQFTTAGSSSEDADAKEGTYVYQTKVSFFRYKVKRGDNLTLIANKYKVTVPQIKQWNKLKTTRLYPGQNLAIKGTIREKVWVTKDNKENKVPNKNPDPVTPAIATTQENYILYTVQQGDTLFSISRQHNVISIDKLKELNKIADEATITPGMKLKVPKG